MWPTLDGKIHIHNKQNSTVLCEISIISTTKYTVVPAYEKF